jgi:hypothetical protein
MVFKKISEHALIISVRLIRFARPVIPYNAFFDLFQPPKILMG